jgi:SulP family sulfate permease
VVALFAWKKWGPRRVPGPVVVMIVATAAVHLLGLAAGETPVWRPVPPGAVPPGTIETIATRFGAIPSGIPLPKLPVIEWGSVPALVWPATTIALLAAIESLLCAVVADGMLGTRHRPDTELIAQGVANMACPLFGGIPATGAIARTATNIQSGGRTPLAGMIHALTLLGILVLLGKYAGLVALPALSAVLVVVAWNMSEFHRFLWLLRGPRPDTAVLLTTFGLTVFTDLTIAVGVGMVLASMLFIRRMADLTNVRSLGIGANGESGDVALDAMTPMGVPRDVEVYDIRGAFFFGAAFKLRETLDQIGKPPRALIVNVKDVLAIDATGLHALEELRRRCVRDGTRLFLVGVHAGPMMAIAREGLLDRFGTENMVGTVEEAIEVVGR